MPTAPVSIAVALADKLDALVGFFAIDEKPTGSSDPYAGAGPNFVGSARALAQRLFDEHAGDREVALITVIHQTILLWDADGNGSIDSAVDLGTLTPQDFLLEDFI